MCYNDITFFIDMCMRIFRNRLRADGLMPRGNIVESVGLDKRRQKLAQGIALLGKIVFREQQLKCQTDLHSELIWLRNELEEQ